MSGLPGTPGLALKVGVAVAGAVYVYWRWTQARERAAKDEWLVLPSFEAKREASSGLEAVEATLPVVVSAAKGMAEQRIPNMRGIMAARTKPLNVVPAEGGVQATAVAKFELPPAKGDCKMVSADAPEELVRLLREEAKVL